MQDRAESFAFRAWRLVTIMLGLIILPAMAPWAGAARAADLLVWADGQASQADRQYRCALGRSGVSAHKREGDGVTPAGSFSPRQAFYRPDVFDRPPACGLPLRALTPDDGWCDDVGLAQYNRPVKLPFAGSHERLWRDDNLYDLIVALGYNDDPVTPGLGSAIFLHVAKPGLAPTAGCVAFDRADLLEIIGRLDPDSKVIIHDRARPATP